MKVLQNITAAMNHNNTVVQQLEATMGNLTLNAENEDIELKNQEDELVKMREEVNNLYSYILLALFDTKYGTPSTVLALRT